MAEAAGLRILGRRVQLDAGLVQALAARGIARLTVNADQVQLSGEFALPGGTVEIRCRELVGGGAVLDVSGRTAPPPWTGPRAANGTPEAVDGKSGQDGLPGMPGGAIRLTCQRIVSAPRLLACGSPGGKSQGGGDGLKPATPAARDAEFNSAKDGGAFGGKVLKEVRIVGVTYKLAIAYGEHGRDGAKGGDGGAPGRPGSGGDGGTIEVTTGDASSPQPSAQVEPGAPGVCGAGGKGAGGGDAGAGGRHRLYRYDLLKGELNLPMDSGDAEVKEARKTYNLAPRAASGKAGAPGKDNAAVFEAKPGAPGTYRWQPVEPSGLAARLDAEFLRHLADWAAQALEQGDAEPAGAMARWGSRLIESGTAMDAATRARLQDLLLRTEKTGA